MWGFMMRFKHFLLFVLVLTGSISIANAESEYTGLFAAMPFCNETDDPDQDVISIAIQDAITNDLWQVKALNTIALPNFKDEIFAEVCTDRNLNCIATMPDASWKTIAKTRGITAFIAGSYKVIDHEKIRITVMWFDGEKLTPNKPLIVETTLNDMLDVLSATLIDVLRKQAIELSSDERKRILKTKTRKYRAWRENGLGYFMQMTYQQDVNGDEQYRRQWERHLAHAVVIDPGYAQAWNNLGYHRKILGKIEAAEYAFGNALRLRPSLIDSLVGISKVMKKNLKTSASIMYLQKAVMLNPSLEYHAQDLIVLLVYNNRYSSAAQQMEKLINHYEAMGRLPSSSSLGLLKAELLFLDGLYKEGLAMMEKYLKYWSAYHSREAIDKLDSMATVLPQIEKKAAKYGFFKNHQPVFNQLINIVVQNPNMTAVIKGKLLLGMANALEISGNYQSAETLWRNALEKLGEGNEDRIFKIKVLDGLTHNLLKRQQLLDAIPFMRELQAAQLINKKTYPNHLVKTSLKLANVLCLLGKPKEALQIIATISQVKKGAISNSAQYAILLQKAEAYRLAGSEAKAQLIYKDLMLKITTENKTAKSKPSIEDQVLLALITMRSAKILLRQDQPEKALRKFNEALAHWESALPGVIHEHLITLYEGMADCAKRFGNINESIIYNEKALEVQIHLHNGKFI
jgi:tetratricopeptide (TPR) repeat protein